MNFQRTKPAVASVRLSRRFVVRQTALSWLVAALLLLLTASGCADACAKAFRKPPSQTPLGSLSDNVWMQQETEAEASKYMLFEHEFKGSSQQLNRDGADHLKQIAARLRSGAKYPVLVERSSSSTRPGKYDFPVHEDPELDMRRREAVVAALNSLGVHDADNRVSVAPALSEGLTSIEAEAAYNRGIRRGARGGAFGGGFGGFGGFGGGGIGGVGGGAF